MRGVHSAAHSKNGVEDDERPATFANQIRINCNLYNRESEVKEKSERECGIGVSSSVPLLFVCMCVLVVCCLFVVDFCFN